MTLFIVEYQAFNNGTATATAPLGYTNENDCMSAYYMKCASAVLSECDTHTVAIVDATGKVWRDFRTELHHGHAE